MLVNGCQRPAGCECKRACLLFQDAGDRGGCLAIWQGSRVFRTMRPVPRTAGAKTRPSGRAVLRVAAIQHRWPIALSLGLSLQMDLIGTVNDTIEYRIGNGRFADNFRTFLHRNLASN